MKHKFVDLYAKWAKDVSELSHCVRAKHGCLLVSVDGERIVAYGFNGAWRGGPNTCSGPNEPGKCECIHAEANALTKPRSQEPFVAFITGEPCSNCAKLLINSLHCKEVYVVQGGYRTQDGVNLLRERLPVTVLAPQEQLK